MQIFFERHRNEQKWGPITYAQHFDDGMILNLFSLMGIEQPTYLDLGAHHPYVISNTALLYEKGWRGINVEANPNLMQEFYKFRPEDINVNVGVGTENCTKIFYMFNDVAGMNSFCEKEIEPTAKIHPIQKHLDLPVVHINEIVEKYCPSAKWPDLLLTDIEGMDYDVLKAADFSKSKPKIIVSETRRHNSQPVKDLLKGRGYFCYCRMGENLFFVLEEYRKNIF